MCLVIKLIYIILKQKFLLNSIRLYLSVHIKLTYWIITKILIKQVQQTYIILDIFIKLSYANESYIRKNNCAYVNYVSDPNKHLGLKWVDTPIYEIFFQYLFQLNQATLTTWIKQIRKQKYNKTICLIQLITKNLIDK